MQLRGGVCWGACACARVGCGCARERVSWRLGPRGVRALITRSAGSEVDCSLGAERTCRVQGAEAARPSAGCTSQEVERNLWDEGPLLRRPG